MADTVINKDKKVQSIILIEGTVNAFVLVAKTLVALSTGSLAVLGDALHSLTDVANNVVAWSVVKHAAKPADKEHPYGHHKFETLAVLGLAVLLAVLGIELGLHAIQKEAKPVVSSSWELAVMLLVLCTNIFLAAWQRAWAKRLNSDILLADASHTFADVLTTIAVIVGWQLSAMGYLLLDQLTALGVAAIILYLAYQLFRKAAPILVDEFAVDADQLSRLVLGINGVEKVAKVRSRWIGTVASLDMIIYVAHDLTTQESHAICDLVERAVELEFDVSDVSIHVEPFHDISKPKAETAK